MNRTVNLTKRVQTAKGLRYCTVVLAANGRVRADMVLVNGQQERHPEGSYYLEWWVESKRIRLSVGKDAADAGARRLQKEAELNAVNNGVAVVAPQGNGSQNGYRSLAVACTEFLDETKLTKKAKTLAAYTTALKYFQESCTKIYLEDIERKDMLKFTAFLKEEKGLHPRTCWNKFSNVMSFLKSNGIRGLVTKNDWPRFVEEEPEVYEQEELDKLFAACDERERLWFEFFLMTGMREQEVMHCSWADVNLSRSTVTVRYKPEYGFSPKNYREREIPIPANLVQSLKAHRVKSAKTCELVFSTAIAGSTSCSPPHMIARKPCRQQARRRVNDPVL
jgi:integrase/recombinase XerD